MGITSEIHAEINAEKLEKIILNGINSNRWNDTRSAIRGFIKEELVKWYYDECGETFGAHKPHKKILEEFPIENFSE